MAFIGFEFFFKGQASNFFFVYIFCFDLGWFKTTHTFDSSFPQGCFYLDITYPGYLFSCDLMILHHQRLPARFTPCQEFCLSLLGLIDFKSALQFVMLGTREYLAIPAQT